MNADISLIIFPLLPLIAITFSLIVKYTLHRDISPAAIIVSSLLQLFTGLIIIYLFHDIQGFHTVTLSEWKHSLELSFDSNRVFFLASYLVPVCLTIFHHSKLTSPNIRILFLFYMAGCSGLIVAGDIFNFYVFYEVMIMSAYILIAVNREFFASIKYMIFGAVSSAIFLAGIILLYASGSYLSFSSIYSSMPDFAPNNVSFILLFFSIAFLIKAAFFPVSGWVATCHSATNSLVSCFLASFTIFSGILGLYYFVIIPAGLTGQETILRFIRFLSVLTIIVPSVILFFEPSLKRCIAGSTVFTIGFVGLLLAGGSHTLAFTYMTVHAVYKSYMFLIYDDLIIDKHLIKGTGAAITLFTVTILFIVGFFPSLPYFIKYNYIGDASFLLKLVTYCSMFLVLGSFFKFSFKAQKIKRNNLYYYLFPLLIATWYYVFPFDWPHSGLYLAVDGIILLTSFYAAAYVNRKLSFLSCLDTKYVYININYELLYIVMLFVVQIMVTRIIT